ncbi:MAG: hypothetical protein IPJ65_22790 [Archangiaceae bacterium]|nr:hypothetical protein [Archangiaceae bacterium]
MAWSELRAFALSLFALAGCVPSVELRGRSCDDAGACPDLLVCVRGACVDNPCPGTDVRPSATLVPACRSWAGFYPGVSPDWGTALAREQQALGTRFDVVHTYHDWFQDWPTAAERDAADAGAYLFFDWSPKNFSNNALVPWSDIASGAEDPAIDARAHALASLGTPVWVSFSAGTQADVGPRGTAAEFVAAFRHLRQRAVAQGASNVVWVLGVGDDITQTQLDSIYPGDAYVDWLGWTVYNSFVCGGGNAVWQGFSQRVAPTYEALVRYGHGDKPFMLTEAACAEDPGDAQRKAGWFAEVADTVPTRFPNLKLVVLHNSTNVCTYAVNSTTAAHQGFSALVKSDAFRPPR